MVFRLKLHEHELSNLSTDLTQVRPADKCLGETARRKPSKSLQSARRRARCAAPFGRIRAGGFPRFVASSFRCSALASYKGIFGLGAAPELDSKLEAGIGECGGAQVFILHLASDVRPGDAAC